jgi:hypothetical protein
LTVLDQQLGGAKDTALFDVCAREGRALVTLDHDFGEVLRFPPERSAGIVILEPGPRATPSRIADRVRELVAILETHPLGRELWIVEPGRVRMHLRDVE